MTGVSSIYKLCSRNLTLHLLSNKGVDNNSDGGGGGMYYYVLDREVVADKEDLQRCQKQI